MAERVYITDEVVVTATRTPYLLKDVPIATDVIKKDEISRTGATTVDRALESMTGVNVDQGFSGAGVSLRGMDPTRVLILLDGERIVGRVRGAIDLSQLSMSNVERIEVVKSAGSTLYGSDAIGGVVNIITADPGSETVVAGSSEYSSFSSFVQTADAQTRLGHWGLQLGGRFYRTDGFDLIEETPHTNGLERIRSFNLSSKATRKLSRSLETKLSGSFYAENKKWIESEYLPPYTYSYDDDENNYRYSGSAKFLYYPNPSTYVDVNLYGTLYDHKWEKFSGSILLDESRTKDRFTEGSILATHVYSPGHVITMGGDILVQSLEGESIVGGEQKITSGDLYAEYEWKPIESMVFLPGVRWEKHSTFGDHVTASINFMANPHPRFRVRASYGGGFRAPSIKELYFRFDHSAAGYLIEGGIEDLEPETSLNTTVSLEYSYKGIGLHRLTYFYNHLNNLIDFDKVGESATYWRGIYRYQNVFRAYTTGIEWQSQIRPTKTQSFLISFTTLTAKNLETGYWLLGRPGKTLSLTYSLELPRFGTTVTAWGNWYSERLWTPIGDQNDFESDLWTPTRRTINLSVAKHLSDFFEVFARAENISDDVDAEFGFWPGRTFHVGLRAKR
jgi:outer membrane receptor for ferrienterochelin and colicins